MVDGRSQLLHNTYIAANKARRKMNIAGMQVYFASDLKDYGYTEDGEKFIGEVYFIEVENKRGDRWRHRTTFDGVRKEQWEEGTAYLDNRPQARAQCERMVVAIQRKGKIDTQHWYQSHCRYGSEAYLDYGQAADLAWEREQEAWSLRADFT